MADEDSPARESLTSLCAAALSRLHELGQQHNGETGQEEEGGRTSIGEAGDVHGHLHASVPIGVADLPPMDQRAERVGAPTHVPAPARQDGIAATAEVEIFGPHSPRTSPDGEGLALFEGAIDRGRGEERGPPQPGALALGGQPDATQDVVRGEPGDGPADPLLSFLISCSPIPPAAALLATPAAACELEGRPVVKPSKRSSGRLAAKPIAGWSTMDKVQMVLLKKSDIWAGDEPQATASKAELQRYREIYKKPLPGKFIAAVEALLDASSGQKGACKSGPVVCT